MATHVQLGFSRRLVGMIAASLPILLLMSGCSDKEVEALFGIGLALIAVVAVFGLAMLAAYIYVLVVGITGIIENRPNMTIGVAGLVLGGLHALGSLSVSGLQVATAGSRVFALLLGGALCYVGYRNIVMAKAKQQAGRPPQPPTHPPTHPGAT